MDDVLPARRITVFGAANLDVIARTRSAPVMGASNPGEVRTTVGGVGFNVAKILARLGHPVRLVTCTGDDPHGRLVRQAIESAGIDADHVTISSADATATYQAVLDDRGGLIIGIAAMDIYERLTPEKLAPAAEESRNDPIWVIDANLPSASIGYLLDKARQHGAFPVALPVSPAKAERLQSHLGKVSLLIANRLESAVLAGEKSSPAETAATLAGRHGLASVVTDGSAPLAIHDGETGRSFQPFSGPVASVNGAGDALAAGIVHGLAAGLPLVRAIAPGLAAASLTLAHPESVPDSLTIDAINRRIAAETAGTS